METAVNALPDFAALEGRVDTVEQAINNLPDTAALEAQIQAVEDTVNNLPDIAALEGRVATLEAAAGKFNFVTYIFLFFNKLFDSFGTIVVVVLGI